MAAVQRLEYRHSLCDFVFRHSDIHPVLFALILDESTLITRKTDSEKDYFPSQTY